MYLDNIVLENVGPLESLRLRTRRQVPDGPPIPIVLVGENGSGKTLVLATIADALHEFAASAFRNVLPAVGLGHSYFKVSGGTVMRYGSSYSFSVLEFSSGQAKLSYVEKVGALTRAQFQEKLDTEFSPPGTWSDSETVKATTQNDALIEQDYQKGVYCFFPANRFEAPHWVNPPASESIAGFSFATRFRGELAKPIAIDSATAETYQWLLDLLLDRHLYADPTQLNVRLWESVNTIVRAIIGLPGARLGVGMRGSGARLAIGLEENGTWVRTIAPSLKHLSAGQGVLLSLFTTILRYADLGGIRNLEEIAGIAVIDEADIHLHSQHQLEVLPRLMQLFPKMQFVLSTHSPLVLLGLAKIYGDDGVQIINLPSGQTILPEAFSEFQAAFDVFRNTRTFETQVAASVREASRRTVLLEGEFDERYIRKAMAVLGRADLLERFDIKWIGHMAPDGPRFTGKTALNQAFNFFKSNGKFVKAPIVFLYDCDANKPDETIDSLFIRSIPRNQANTKVVIGIENALPSELFEDRFYRTREETSDLGERKVNQVFDKSALCNFVCDERQVSEEQAALDFAGFLPIAAILDAIP